MATERNSEMKMVWTVIVIVGAHVLGIDLHQISLWLDGVHQASEAVTGASNSLGTGDISLSLLTGLYAFNRTRLKQTKAETDAAVEVAASKIPVPPISAER